MADPTLTVTGTGVVPGFAYAPAAWTRARPVPPADNRSIAEDDRPAEGERFKNASLAVGARLSERASHASGVAAEVLAATANLATDRGWQRATIKLINAGSSAEAATTASTEQFCEMFLKVGGLMAERVTDLRDVRDRVIAEMMGLPEPGVPTPDAPVILLADDLAPADTAGLDPALIRGIATRLGGPTSHTSIIARQLGIPCVVAAAALRDIPDATPILIDGTRGTLEAGVPVAEAQAKVTADAARREAIRTWRGPAQTKDRVLVDVLANVQDGAGAARAAATSEAGGVGLFRTELCFLSAQTEPSVAEQARIYGEVFSAFPGKKVVVRTLDAGSDKPVPFAKHEHEENPALGVRGIRLWLTNEGLIERQLDAIAAAGEDNGVERPWVMAPMIATVDEARRFAALCAERDLKPGIMVEVPSVALLADEFLAEVEFFSIGTNDLTQYAMAADRMSSPLATLTDPWQPAVLRLIKMTADAGRRAGKPVGVCGEAAADPFLACILLGMGVTSLSMAASAVAAVGVQLESVTLEQCQEASAKVLAMSTAAETKALAQELLS